MDLIFFYANWLLYLLLTFYSTLNNGTTDLFDIKTICPDIFYDNAADIVQCVVNKSRLIEGNCDNVSFIVVAPRLSNNPPVTCKHKSDSDICRFTPAINECACVNAENGFYYFNYSLETNRAIHAGGNISCYIFCQVPVSDILSVHTKSCISIDVRDEELDLDKVCFKPNFTDPNITVTETNPSVTSTVTDPSLTSTVTDPSITSNVTDKSVTGNMTDPSITSNVTDPSITSNVTDPSITSNMRNLQFSEVEKDFELDMDKVCSYAVLQAAISTGVRKEYEAWIIALGVWMHAVKVTF